MKRIVVVGAGLIVLIGAATFFVLGRSTPVAEAIDLGPPPPASADAPVEEPTPPAHATRERVPVPRAPATDVARSVVELQTGRTTQTIEIPWDDSQARVELVDLQPNIGAWYLLRLTLPDQRTLSRHLLASNTGRGTLELDASSSDGLRLRQAGESRDCALWPGGDLTALEIQDRAYTPLCDGAIFLLSQVQGHRTSKEWVTDFLRDRVRGGEQVTSFVKEEVLKDAHLMRVEIERAPELAAERDRPEGAPRAGRLEPRYETAAFAPTELGIALDAAGESLLVGRWYPTKSHDGIFVAGLTPSAVPPPEEGRSRLNALDEVERDALTYLVAYDLDRYALGFALGTEHPRVGWSDRALPTVRVDGIPGPDGFGEVDPLVRSGRLRPDAIGAVVSTFVGGFKRTHGAFRTGELSQKQRGSHYGFIEEGVVLSSLEPGLATVLVEKSGSVRLETWQSENDVDLGDIRFARQNGVPLVETNEQGHSVPGSLVTRWADGNWSGSQDRKFRTLRSALCLQPADDDGEDDSDSDFLIYGYFSSVTPSAMARVFLAYGCSYALMLDMNALEHSYLALYDRSDADTGWAVQHVVQGMEVLDQSYQGYVVPRFVSYPDNRDFFYLTRRTTR